MNKKHLTHQQFCVTKERNSNRKPKFSHGNHRGDDTIYTTSCTSHSLHFLRTLHFRSSSKNFVTSSIWETDHRKQKKMNIKRKTVRPATETTSGCCSPSFTSPYLSMNSDSEIVTTNLWGYGESPLVFSEVTCAILSLRYSWTMHNGWTCTPRIGRSR